MKKVLLLLLVFVFALPLMAEEFKNAAVVDVQCSSKMAKNPDAHTKSCALQCQKGGFGIYTSDGKFLKFDSSGNQKLLDALKATDKTDHLRVNVKGDVAGDTIKVQSLSMS